MNWDQIQGKWSQARGQAKERWGELTDDDLDRVDGMKDQLVGRIQERYGIAKEEAEQQADEFASSLSDEEAHARR
ncbi:MAG: CsbD family protein [Dehalococcoidia bacterium]